MIGIGILGTGSIASKHIAAARAFPHRCNVAALYNHNPQKAYALGQSMGLDAPVRQTIEEFLRDESVRLAVVCAPPGPHKDIVLACLNAGKDVLVEKPMALSVAEADEMIAAAKTNGRMLSVVSQNRFTDEHMKLKATLDSGLLGPVRFARVDSCWWRGEAYYDAPWRGAYASEGGGATTAQAIHHIDLLLWMMGMPKAVSAMARNLAHPAAEVEDVSVATLDYGDAMAVVTSSVLHHGQKKALEFQCQRGGIGAPFEVWAESARPDGFPEENAAFAAEVRAYWDNLPNLPYRLFEGQLDDALSALETGRAPAVTGEDGRRALELIDRIYRAAGIERRQP